MVRHFERLTPYYLDWSRLLDSTRFIAEPWGEDDRQRFKPPPPPEEPGIVPGIFRKEPHLRLSGREIWEKCLAGTACWVGSLLELEPNTANKMRFDISGNASAAAILRTMADAPPATAIGAEREYPVRMVSAPFYYLHHGSRLSELSARTTRYYQLFGGYWHEDETSKVEVYDFMVREDPIGSPDTHLEDFFDQAKSFDLAVPQLAYREFFKTRAGEFWAAKFAFAWAGRREVDEGDASTEAEPKRAELPPTQVADTQLIVAAIHRLDQGLQKLSQDLAGLHATQVAVVGRLNFVVLLLVCLVLFPVVIVGIALSR